MAALLEEAGRLSARAQALPAPITSLVRAGPRVPLHLSSSVRRPPRLVSTFDLVPVPVPVPAVSPSPTARLPHLPVVIASSSSSQERLHADQRLYIASHDASDPSRGPSVVLGFLKVGEKRLFVSDPRGNTVEIEPCCVLDFYVHESCQRGGIGSELFARFLEEEDHRPARLAYDRPSHKLKSFLRCVLSHTGPHTTAFAW
jgi:GNAT superfamily N-acetyltransferase|tara:strand:+ start:144 stop:746 length:603 start_codon:yes stop_codon:yes gene_type:complete